MGKKYIIEIPEDKITDFVGSTHFLMPYMMAGHIGHHDTGLPIEPYTEPDLEQVRKEAYQKGYDDAVEKIGSDEQAIADKAYKKGLSDAKEGKATCQYCEYQYLDDTEEPCKKCCNAYMNKYKPKAKEEQIQVGDEVITGAGKAVVIGVGPVHFEFVYADGSTGYDKVKNVKKTGRHFPEIAEVLRKMKDEDNG